MRRILIDEPERILTPDSVLLRLDEQDPRAAEVVQLRYLAGMTVARAWLRKTLRQDA